MLGNSKRGVRLNLMAGICVLALSAGWSAARAQDSTGAIHEGAGSEPKQEASAATDARASAPAPAIAVPEPQETESHAAATTGETVTPLNQVEVKPAPKPGVNTTLRPYYIEFRARAAYNYGHAFVVHGRVGEPLTKRSVVGLHPIGEAPTFWLIGHVVPVPSETGWSDGDIGYNDRYITAKYRIFLTEAEYRVVSAKLREMQHSSPVWSAELYNCVAFVGDIAAFLGLQHPFHWVMPKEYIEGIRYMAGGRQELPSRWLESVNPRLAAQQAAQFAQAQHAAQQTEQAAQEPAQQQAQPQPQAQQPQPQPQAQQPQPQAQQPTQQKAASASRSTPRRQHASADTVRSRAPVAPAYGAAQ
jgi:hypothetical protein